MANESGRKHASDDLMIIALFLDDDHPYRSPIATQRVRWFEDFKARRQLTDENTEWVTDARTAILRLKSGRIRFISLDHDLAEPGHAVYPFDKPPQLISHEENLTILEAGAKSGYDVARWIFHAVQAGMIPSLTWEIHSQNGIGRDNMADYLNRL
jgi:hypothetical protein